MSATIASCFLAFAVGFVATLVITAISRNLFSPHDGHSRNRRASRVTFTLRCSNMMATTSAVLPDEVQEEVEAIFAVTNETVEKLEWLLHCGNRSEALHLLVDDQGISPEVAEAALDLIDAPVYGSYH